MLESSDESLSRYFAGTVMTIFITDLQQNYKEEALHIFDVFLTEGDNLI